MNGGIVFILAVLVDGLFGLGHAESLEDRIKTLETTVSKQSADMQELKELVKDQRKTNSDQQQELYRIKKLFHEKGNKVQELNDRIGHLQSTLEDHQDQIKLLQQPNPVTPIQSDKTIHVTQTQDDNEEYLYINTGAEIIEHEKSSLRLSLKSKEAPLKYNLQYQKKAIKKLTDESKPFFPETGYAQNIDHAFRHKRTLDERVAFHAVARPHEIQNLGAGQIIKFNVIQLNLGNGYQNNIGIFIAPKAGLYLFSTSITARYETRFLATLNKNGQLLARIAGISTNWNGLNQGSVTIVALLNTGDNISVNYADHAGGTIWGNYYTGLSGVLLSPM